MPATPTQELLDYAACNCVLTPVDAMRIALLDQISQNIAPGGETFYLLWDVGDNIMAPQVGDRFVYQ